MSGLEDLIGAEVTRALDEARAFRRARERLVHTLRNGLLELESPRILAGLARVRTRERLAQGAPAPRGWRLERLESRHAYLELPLWLWLLRAAWASRWQLVHLAIAAGLLELEDGGYYRDARPRCPSWLWCFVHDVDRDPRRDRVPVPALELTIATPYGIVGMDFGSGPSWTAIYMDPL